MKGPARVSHQSASQDRESARPQPVVSPKREATGEKRGPVVLVVLDGFGSGDGGPGDATALAHAPFFAKARRTYPHAQLETSGEAVGLPPGQMGNSEVGHMTMGSGRIIEQDLMRITHALERGELERNAAIRAALEKVRVGSGRLHIMGLVSDGGVHSHLTHIAALIDHAGVHGIAPVLHAFFDGRDTPPRSGLGYLRKLLPHVERADGRVATVSGRYYAMDRDRRWERTALAYAALIEGKGIEAPDAETAVQQSYARNESDEFIRPTLIAGGAPIADGDVVIFANFRADRARQLTNALTRVAPQKLGAEIAARPPLRLADFVCFTEYDADFGLPTVFPPYFPEKILGEIIAERGLQQLRVAETEKYAHVTFFFNGGREEPFPGEDRILVPSPRDVPTYDLKPEMSAHEVSERLIEKLDEENYAFVLVNFANPDMVGHTGVLTAAVKAVETIDECLARVSAAVLARGGYLLITADHGNCEQMLDAAGEPHTAHTTNPVPIYWITHAGGGVRLRDGGLSDIAPTVLELLRLPVPDVMTGKSLLVGE